VRPVPWFLLLPWLLLSLPAAAQEGAHGQVLQRRTLVAPARPGEVPPLELHVATGVATLVQLGAPLKHGALKLPEGTEHIQLGPMGEDALVLLPTRNLSDEERVLLTVDTEPGAEPLRFVLVTRRGVADVQVRVVPAPSAPDEDGAELMARSLLEAPDARPRLVLPRELVKRPSRDSFGQVESVLWLDRRFFAPLSVRSRKEGASPWRLVQARMRATLADGVLLEWPARLFSGVAGTIRQRHILTGLLPEGASRLELALDAEDSPGDFRPLAVEEEAPRP